MLTDETFTVILVGVAYTLTLIFLTSLYKMTKIRKYTIPSAAALAVATALGLATAPAQAAAIIEYNGCASTSFCLFSELAPAGGGAGTASITIDEDGDGKIDKKFDKWTRTGVGTPPADLQISAFGAPLSGGLTFSTATGWNVPPNNLSNQFLFDVTAVNPDLLLTTIKADLITSTSTGMKGIQVNASGAIISDIAGFKTPTDIISLLNPVTDTINLSISGVSFGLMGSAQLKEFKLTFAQSLKVPEPGTVVGLLAVGGLGLAMKRRQQR